MNSLMYIMKSQNQMLNVYIHMYNNNEKSYEAMIIIYFIKSYILD